MTGKIGALGRATPKSAFRHATGKDEHDNENEDDFWGGKDDQLQAKRARGTRLLGFGAFLQELQNSCCLFAGGLSLVFSPTLKSLLRNSDGVGYFGRLLEDNIPVVPE